MKLLLTLIAGFALATFTSTVQASEGGCGSCTKGKKGDKTAPTAETLHISGVSVR